MAGIPRIKLNLTQYSREKPSSRPLEMVEPEREMPGMIAVP